jgi:hypothetical protein
VTPHFMKESGLNYDLAEVTGLAALLADWWSNDDYEGETNQAARASFSDDMILTSITVTALALATPAQFTQSVGVSGELAGAPLPNESALVTTLYTGIVGRSYRGRNFWPGVATASMQANGTLLDATTAQLQETFDALIVGTKAASNSVMCVHSTTLGLATEVTSCVVRDVLHHQRRRNQ